MKLMPCLAILLGIAGAVSAAAPASAPGAEQAALSRDWGDGICLGELPKKEQVAAVAKAGIRSINLMINWPAHAAADKPYTLDPAYLKKWVEVLDQAQANQLRVVVGLFPYEGLMKDPQQHEDRFVSLWEQVAKGLQAQPATVAFELLPEPNGKLDAERWNKLLARALAAIRQSSPDRLVVVGPTRYYNDYAFLQLPDDPHLAIAFHSWLVGKDVWEGTDAQKKAITDRLDRMAGWAQKLKHPVILTQFGMNVGNGDKESRLRWVGAIARAAEARHIPWIYAHGSGGNFGLFDPATNELRAQVQDALLPALRSSSDTRPDTQPTRP